MFRLCVDFFNVNKPLNAETPRRRENQENIGTLLFSVFVFSPRLSVSAANGLVFIIHHINHFKQRSAFNLNIADLFLLLMTFVKSSLKHDGSQIPLLISY